VPLGRLLREERESMDLELQLREIFSRIFPLVPEHRTMSYGDENWDSLKHIELVSEVESVFDISLEIDELDRLSSFSSALEFLSKRSEF
jgi:acyl carrier protein